MGMVCIQLTRIILCTKQVNRRKHTICAFVSVQSNADLFHTVEALCSTRRLPRRLNGGKQQSEQNANDRYRNQALNDREATLSSSIDSHHDCLQNDDLARTLR